MPKPHPVKVREICIHQYLMGLDIKSISKLTDIPTRTVRKYARRYRLFGTVLTDSELFGDDRGRPREISDDDLVVMLDVWMRDPTLYLDEVATEMSLILGRYINPYNLKYWKKKMKITRKKLWQVYTSLFCLLTLVMYLNRN